MGGPFVRIVFGYTEFEPSHLRISLYGIDVRINILAMYMLMRLDFHNCLKLYPELFNVISLMGFKLSM